MKKKTTVKLMNCGPILKFVMDLTLRTSSDRPIVTCRTEKDQLNFKNKLTDAKATKDALAKAAREYYL